MYDIYFDIIAFTIICVDLWFTSHDTVKLGYSELVYIEFMQTMKSISFPLALKLIRNLMVI